MCGRFSEKYTWKDLHELYSLIYSDTEAPVWTPKFNIAPTKQIPVIRFTGGARRVDLMRWGLIPAWSKDIGKFSTFNARADGVAEKPAYRGAWKAGRRCIISASSFFEWRKADKQPFAISLGNHGPLAFAGLWEEWKPKDGAPVLSCTIITTEANKLMAPIHDRMPAILGAENWAAWLGEEAATAEQLRVLLAPFPAERMSAWEVGKDVGKVQNQGEGLVEALP